MSEELKVGDRVKFPDLPNVEFMVEFTDNLRGICRTIGNIELNYREYREVKKDCTIYGVKVCEKVQPEPEPDYASWPRGARVRAWDNKNDEAVEGIWVGYDKGRAFPCVVLPDDAENTTPFDHAELIEPEVTDDPATWVGKMVYVRDRDADIWAGPYVLTGYLPENVNPFIFSSVNFKYAKLAEEQE